MLFYCIDSVHDRSVRACGRNLWSFFNLHDDLLVCQPLFAGLRWKDLEALRMMALWRLHIHRVPRRFYADLIYKLTY